MQHLIRSRRQAWIAWLLTASAVLCMNCWTLVLSPVIFQDEIQIVDLGRAALPGADLTWGLQWSSQGRAARTPAFLGAALQELAFRFSDAQIFGPRLSSQIGLLLASAALLGWMTTVGVSPTVAFLGSLLLLMEPTLTQGTRGGRIDGLAIFFVILACWIVSATPRQSNGVALLGLCAAGICLALSLLVWPSSLLAFPLLWIPLFARNAGDRRPTFSRVLKAFAELGLLGVICAGSVAFAVACLPGHGAAELTDFRAGLSGTTSVSAAGAVSWAAGMGTLFTDLKSSPWLIPWAFCGMLFRRRWAILLPACASIAGVIATRVYFYRTVYVVPILLIAGIVASDEILKDRRNSRTNTIGLVLTAGLLLVSFASSLAFLGARTYIALHQRDTRDPAILEALAASTIGPGPLRVYLGPWEFYPAGRRLGWRMYRNGLANQLLDWEHMPEFLDCAILEPVQIPGLAESQLKAHGFAETTVRPTMPVDAPARGKNYDHEYILYFRAGVGPRE